MKNELRDVIKDRFEQKADKTRTFYGYLGDTAGTVVVPGKSGFVFVTLSDGMVMQAYNTIAPLIRNLPVICGYDPRQARSELFRVLDVRDLPRIGEGTSINQSSAHHASHEWLNASGSTDILYVHLRQFLPLRPEPVKPYLIYINRAIFQTASSWATVGNVSIDLTSYVPAAASGSFGNERFALISISGSTGGFQVTAGSEVASGSSSAAMIPAVPAGHYPICAVRLYSNQQYIIEGRTQTDLIDMRWGMFREETASQVVPSTHSPVTDFYLTGYDSVTGLFTSGSVIGGSGSSTSSGSQIVPLDHEPVENFYLTGYSAASGSFSSGSVVGGTSGSGTFPVAHSPVANYYLTGYDAVSGSFSSGSVLSSVDTGDSWSVQEDFSASCNGSDKNFATSEAFTTGTTMVFLNGILQRPGAGNDYTEDAGLNGVTFGTAPLTGDHLMIAYIKSGTGASKTTITDIYIATTGSDTGGDGTSGNPYATMVKALSVLPDHLYSSVSIHVADGTYAEGIDIERFRCQSPVFLKIIGNTTTPANVVFTGTISHSIWDNTANDTFGCVISGMVNVELDGLKINITGTTGLLIEHHAYVIMDMCIVTGTLSIYGVRVTDHSTLELHEDNTISGVAFRALNIGEYSNCNFNVAGTLTITGDGTNTVGIFVGYCGKMVCGWVTGLLIVITEVKEGIVACLQSVFQHYSATGSISISNGSTPSNSIACTSADASTLSTNQDITIDHFSIGFKAYCTAYLEAMGGRTLTNVSTASTSSLGGQLYLP